MKQDENLIISLGRQYGSGGRDIAIALSKMLGIKYYDKQIMSEAAQESGLNAECFEAADERSPASFLYALSGSFFVSGDYSAGFNDERLFAFQSDAIKKIAKRESAVIVGRCSDYILRNNKRMISLFIFAPMEKRIKNVAKREQLSQRAAMDRIKKIDKERASYYNFYTDKQWGQASSYNICVDSSLMSVEDMAEMLFEMIQKIDCKNI